MPDRLPTAILGRTGLEVTRLGYGALELKGPVVEGRDLTDAEASGVLDAVLDSGINLIDTADCYGLSEETVGKHLSRRRSEYVLTTKAGCHRDNGPSGGAKDLTREGLIYSVERSLRRLRTDCIDLLQLHTPSVKRGIHVELGPSEREEVLATLGEMREQGKFRWLGISTNLPHVAHFYNWDVFDAYHAPVLGLPARARGLDREARGQSNLGTIIRSGAARGEPDHEGSVAYLQGVLLSPETRWRYFQSLDLDSLRDPGGPLPQSRVSFILRYCLAHPGIDTVINGTINLDELRENVRTAERGPLPPQDVVDEVNRRVSTVDTNAGAAGAGQDTKRPADPSARPLKLLPDAYGLASPDADKIEYYKLLDEFF